MYFICSVAFTPSLNSIKNLEQYISQIKLVIVEIASMEIEQIFFVLMF